ncbi:hypothetical protein IAU60_002435 [Kwoniella sp. DSM 27419]
MAACATALPKLTHPALAHGPAPPPRSPVLAQGQGQGKRSPPAKVQPRPPAPSYHLLRSHHATALRYTITKLRWEQANGQYLAHQDADWLHDVIIDKLEKELKGVEAARKGLDRFDICFAPTAQPKPHGPLTRDEEVENKRLEREKDKVIQVELEKRYPFLKQMFIGPMTKQQARNDKMLRELLKEGDEEDIPMLLPSENMRWFIADQARRAGLHAHPAVLGGAQKRSYEHARFDKEKAKVAAYLETHPQPRAPPSPKALGWGPGPLAGRVGPLTKDEWMSTLPMFGPPTELEALLQVQRAHRSQVIRFLQKPWGTYNERAAGAIEILAALAREKFDEEKKARMDAEAGKLPKGPDGANGEAEPEGRGVKGKVEAQEPLAVTPVQAILGQ